MLRDKTVGVVVSCYNEETQIGRVIETMPDFVDRIIVINDFSKDRTAEVVTRYLRASEGQGIPLSTRRSRFKRDPFNGADEVVLDLFDEESRALTPRNVVNKTPENDRVILINHTANGGKGGAVATGFWWAREYSIDCVVTIDGDGQMDPGEMERMCLPIVTGEVDFVKGNRFAHRSAQRVIPGIRFFGNSVLSILTKLASGYWGVTDTQTGYTSFSMTALENLRLHKIYQRYGVPNDLLIKMNIANALIKEIPIKPVYNVGEQSKMKILNVIPKISALLLANFFRRIWLKYFLKSFHPLFVFYHLGFFLSFISLIFLCDILWALGIEGHRPPLGVYLTFFTSVTLSFQTLLFAMWMDIQDNSRLDRSR